MLRRTLSRKPYLTFAGIIILVGFLVAVGLFITGHANKVFAATASSSTPCVSAAPPTQWQHVVVLMFENKTYGQVIGNSSAPYITGLAKQCATYSDWHDADYRVNGTTRDGNYNSKPNYATLTSGVSPSVHGLIDDTYNTTSSVENIYNRLNNAGISAKDYYDSSASSTPCSSSSFSGDYHDAIRYFKDLGGQSSSPSTYCNTHDVSLSKFMNDVNNNTLPAFSLIIPTNSENMHDNSTSSGDTWAKNFLSPLFDSALYKSGNTAVFFLWDEDTPIPNVLIAPSIVAGTKPSPSGSAPFSHFSALRTWQEMLGITPLLGDSGQAPSLLSVYNGNGNPVTDNPPAVNITAPASGTTITTSPVTLSANASDDKDVTKVEFYDGSTLIGTDTHTSTASTYSTSWNTSSLSGSHTLIAKAYDNGGHVTTSTHITVTVSITSTCGNKPDGSLGTSTIVVNSPAQGSYHVWSRLMAPDSTNNSYFMQLDGNCPFVVGDSASIPVNSWTWIDYQNANPASLSTASLSAGNHTITMYGREPGVKLDRVLLLSSGCTPTGTGDNCSDSTPPTVSVTAPSKGATVSGSSVLLSASAIDNSSGSGVAKVDFLVDGNMVGSMTSAPYHMSWNSTTVTNASHTIQAVATDNAGNSATSATITVTVNNTDTTPPTPPSNLQVTKNTANEVDLTWKGSTDNIGVTGYQVLRNSVSIATVSSTAATAYRDTSVTTNTSYTYSIVAFDAAGNVSPPSNTVNVTTPPSTDTTPPTTPTNLTATAASSTQVDLNWKASTDNVDVTGYVILRDNNVIAQVNGTATSYSDTRALPATSYTYNVYAFDAAGNNSHLSNNATVKTPNQPDTTPPSAPKSLAATAASPTQVNLTWTASTDNVGVKGYFLYRDGVKIATTTTTSFGDATVSPATTYTYYAVAFDAAGNVSTHSSQVKVTTPSKSPQPQKLTILASGDADIHQEQAGTNYAKGVTLPVSINPKRDFLMKFRVDGVGTRTVTSAKLRLWVESSADSGGIFSATTNRWNATKVTWSNAPARREIIKREWNMKKNTYRLVDLTPDIHGDGVYSIRVYTHDDDIASYASRNDSNADHRPKLILTVQ